jgi:cell wall assembly regulator SMI1
MEVAKMSELTDKLEYILSWLKSKNLEFSDCYNPGLTKENIDKIMKDFPFKLSKEFYELYQWRNGISEPSDDNSYCREMFLFPEQRFSYESISFCSLEDSLYLYRLLCKASVIPELELWRENWLPIGAFESKHFLYILGDLDPSPVYLWDANCIPFQARVYNNITSMVSVIAECCELDLYKFISGNVGLDDIFIDEDKLDLEKVIYQKYNS